MRKIIWIAGGIVIIAILLFIPDSSGELWLPVWLSSAAALLYLVLFSWNWLMRIESKRKRTGLGILLGALVLFTTIYAFTAYKSSQRAKVWMPESHLQFVVQEARLSLTQPLLTALRSYYQSGEEQSLNSLFISNYDSLLNGNNQNRRIFSSPSLDVYLAVSEPDSIVIIGESESTEGLNQDFQNHTGLTGKFQARGILTPNGIEYERQN